MIRKNTNLFFIVLLIILMSILIKQKVDKPTYTKMVYIVKPGDTLWSIGEKNASNSEDIRKWISEVKTINNMNTCEIRGGEEIIVLKEN